MKINLKIILNQEKKRVPDRWYSFATMEMMFMVPDQHLLSYSLGLKTIAIERTMPMQRSRMEKPKRPEFSMGSWA